MKRLLLSTLIVATAAFAPAAERVGLASAKGEYLLVRGEETFKQRAVLMNEVSTEDVVRSLDAPVRVAIPETGAAVMLSPDSSMAFPGAGSVELISGGGAVSIPQGTSTAVNVQNLSVTPISSQKSDTMFVARFMDEETLSVQGFEGRLAVKDVGSGQQVAVVGPGDQMIFTVREGVWTSSLQSLGQPGIFRMQDGNQDGNESGEADESSDRRRTGALLIGGGVVAVGAASYFVYEETKDDNDDEDDGGRNRQGTTPTSSQSVQ